MKKLNDVKSWNMGVLTVAFTGKTFGDGVLFADIHDASQHTPIGATLTVPAPLKALLGVCWDCAVCIRERMVTPMSPGYKEIRAVYDQLLAHLGKDQFELFLRPNAKVGLPSASAA